MTEYPESKVETKPFLLAPRSGLINLQVYLTKLIAFEVFLFTAFMHILLFF